VAVRLEDADEPAVPDEREQQRRVPGRVDQQRVAVAVQRSR
jgi:hypothetical protein